MTGYLNCVSTATNLEMIELKQDILSPIAKTLIDNLRVLIRYHRYSVVGLENIPSEGRVVLAVSHSFATYDGLLLGAVIHAQRGRYIRGLGHDHLFSIPGLRELVQGLSMAPASPTAGRDILRQGHILALAPGGLREALRSSRHRYEVWWRQRTGFVKLAIETQSPIILAVCPSADDIFTIYSNPVTQWAYDRFRFPVPLFRGIGPTIIPRPVKLTHYLSPPLHPPPFDSGSGAVSTEQLGQFHERVLEAADALLAHAIRESSHR